MTPSELKILDGNQYLAPHCKTYDFEDFSINITSYDKPVEKGAWHCHKNPMLSYVVYGKNTESRTSKKQVRTTGNVTFYHSYEPHQNSYQDFPSKHISLEIAPSFLKANDFSEISFHNALATSNQPQLFLARLFHEAQLKDALSKHSIEMDLLSFLQLETKAIQKKYRPNWVSKLKAILHDRWDENLSLSELSLELGIHPCTISKHFSTYFSCTMGEYSRRLKTQKALVLMQESQYSLTEIAYLCGFSDQSHFTRTVKATIGFLPKEFCKL